MEIRQGKEDYSEMARDYMSRLGVSFSQVEDFETAVIQCKEALESLAKQKDEAMDELRQENEKLAKALWKMWYAGYCLFGDGSWSMDEEPHFKKVYEDCGEILKGYQK